jgi:hypothetical protein
MSAMLSMAALWAGCTGLGIAALSPFRLLDARPADERIAVAFAAGMGLFGWLMFFPGIAGWMNIQTAIGLCATGILAGLATWRRGEFGNTEQSTAPAGRWTALLLAVLVIVLAQDVIEAMAPPADADSLAYHFALPKQFALAGAVEFVPRAGTGAAPFLLHMTYTAAYLMGGEGGLTGWAMLSGWMAGALFFVLARPRIGRDWALAGALAVLTVPAMLYGAGTGQVEARIACFVMVGVFATAQAIRSGNGADAAMAGTMAGFYAGSKFMGLLFCAAAGATMLLARRRIAVPVWFGVFAVAAGGQWYWWNWLHTGDPLFPVLFRALNLPDSAIWTHAFDNWYRGQYFGAENPIPQNFLSFLTFPFVALLSPPPEIEAGRTGFGPLPLLLLPLAAAGAWRARRNLHGPLGIAALIVLLFYGLWFWSGTSQRVRHLVPLYPVLLLCMVTAAKQWVVHIGAARVLAAALGATIGIQMAGQALQTRNLLPIAIGRESEDAFLDRNTPYHAASKWLNTHLGPDDKVMVVENEMVYPLNVPVYYAHPRAQAVIDLSAGGPPIREILKRVRAEGITYLMLAEGVAPDGTPIPGSRQDRLDEFIAALMEQNYVDVVARFPVRRTVSRTLAAIGAAAPKERNGVIYRLKNATCTP